MIRFLSTCERPSPCSSPYVLPTQNNWPVFEHISLAHASSSWLLCTHLYCNLVPLEKTSLTSLKRPSCSLLNSYVHYACCLASVMSNSLGPHGLQPTSSSVHGILQARTLEWVAVPSSRDLPNAGIKLMSLTAPHWQVGSLALAPPGKPKRSDFFQAPVALDLPVGWECVEQSTKQYLTLSSSTQLFCALCHSNSTILFMTSH